MNEHQSGATRSYDWNLIKSFLAILDHGTLSAAAIKLNISQPTLSRHIEELENSLGVVLFERGRRGAAPTAAALAVADHAREINIATQAISLSATGKSQELHGTVRITASQIVATYLLPAILTRLMNEAPQVEIELVATDEVENLTQRDADIAVRMVRPQNPNLIARKVNEIHMGIYGRKDYLKTRPPIHAPHDLDHHRLIGYDTDERIISGMAELGVIVERNFFRFRCDDQVTCWQALCDGLGLGFAPNYLARTNQNLERLAEQFAIPPLPVWLVTHREIKSNRRIRMVFDFLAEELAGLDLN
ncbi:MAG: LysR family transcriptional regulator [Rhizobiaceae bacterium]|nr:LysR family transcriptional regulator [Rhizobiaceae bacterium]